MLTTVCHFRGACNGRRPLSSTNFERFGSAIINDNSFIASSFWTIQTKVAGAILCIKLLPDERNGRKENRNDECL